MIIILLVTLHLDYEDAACVLVCVCVCLLTEAEEERVDTHVVHAKESVSDEVAAEHHRLRQTENKVEKLLFLQKY